MLLSTEKRVQCAKRAQKPAVLRFSIKINPEIILLRARARGCKMSLEALMRILILTAMEEETLPVVAKLGNVLADEVVSGVKIKQIVTLRSHNLSRHERHRGNPRRTCGSTRGRPFRHRSRSEFRLCRLTRQNPEGRRARHRRESGASSVRHHRRQQHPPRRL